MQKALSNLSALEHEAENFLKQTRGRGGVGWFGVFWLVGWVFFKGDLVPGL